MPKSHEPPLLGLLCVHLHHGDVAPDVEAVIPEEERHQPLQLLRRDELLDACRRAAVIIPTDAGWIELVRPSDAAVHRVAFVVEDAHPVRGRDVVYVAAEREVRGDEAAVLGVDAVGVELEIPLATTADDEGLRLDGVARGDGLGDVRVAEDAVQVRAGRHVGAGDGARERSRARRASGISFGPPEAIKFFQMSSDPVIWMGSIDRVAAYTYVQVWEGCPGRPRAVHV